MHGLAAYFKEGLPFAQEILENLYEISRKVSGFLPMFSTVLIHSVSYFFFLYQSPSSYYQIYHHHIIKWM